MAVPSTVAQLNVTGVLEGWLSSASNESVLVPVSPSFGPVGVDGEDNPMRPVVVPVRPLGGEDGAYVAPVTFAMATVRYSSGSMSVSPLTVTEKLAQVEPAGMVTVPLAPT